jgi:hypothetical protein
VLSYVIDKKTSEPRPGKPHDSLWWIKYVTFQKLMTPQMHYEFRICFRMPFDSWHLLVQRLEENELFAQWHYGSTDAVGKPSSPIELLSLGALRYIGRKHTFDGLEELTFITSERMHEHFFKHLSNMAQQFFLTSLSWHIKPLSWRRQDLIEV